MSQGKQSLVDRDAGEEGGGRMKGQDKQIHWSVTKHTQIYICMLPGSDGKDAL